MQKEFTILLFLLTINFNTLAQDVYTWSKKPDPKNINTLTKKLLTLKDSARIDCLNEITEVYLTSFARDADTAKVYAKQALEEAEKITYLTGMAKAYKNLGRSESILVTDLPSTEKYFSRALSLFIKIGDDQQIALSWANLGYAKWVLCKFPEAMEAYQKAVEFFEKKGDTNNLAATYEFISFNEIDRGQYGNSLKYALKRQDLTGEENYDILGNLYQELGDYETAQDYYRKMPLTSRGIKYVFRGKAFYLDKKYDSAFYYYQLFSNYAKPSGEGELSKLYAHLGELYHALKLYDTAMVYLSNALHMHKKSNDINQVMNVLLILSKTHLERKDYRRAMYTAQELWKLADETGARQYRRDVHFLLSEIFEHLQKKDSAYVHLRQYTILKDSIDNDLSQQKLAFYKTKSEREYAQSKINTLNDEKKLQQQQLKQTAQQKNFLIAGIVAVLLIAVVIFRNISLKRKNEKLRLEHELELQQLESEKTKVELQQQTTDLEMQALRAQMNPHFIFNCLNAINGFILVNESETAADYLTKFSRLVRLILQNSQVAFISLESELESLKLYLELEALRFNNRFECNIIVADGLDLSAMKVPPLIIQPYTENAIRHGLMHKEDKGNLNIAIEQNNGHLIFKISDDGIGRKAAAVFNGKSTTKHKSVGLKITAERIAILQSSNNIESSVTINDLVNPDGTAAGTEVIIKIPVNY